MFYFHHKEFCCMRRHYFLVVRNDGLDAAVLFGLLLLLNRKSLLKFNFSELCLILIVLCFSNGRSLMSVAVNTTL
jgi:hypothetical protein